MDLLLRTPGCIAEVRRAHGQPVSPSGASPPQRGRTASRSPHLHLPTWRGHTASWSPPWASPPQRVHGQPVSIGSLPTPKGAHGQLVPFGAPPLLGVFGSEQPALRPSLSDCVTKTGDTIIQK